MIIPIWAVIWPSPDQQGVLEQHHIEKQHIVIAGLCYVSTVSVSIKTGPGHQGALKENKNKEIKKEKALETGPQTSNAGPTHHNITMRPAGRT